MKDVSNKNNLRFPSVRAGQRILVTDAKIPLLNNVEGVILEAPQQDRSPHKAIYKVRVIGPLASHNPWYVFRTEFEPL